MCPPERPILQNGKCTTQDQCARPFITVLQSLRESIKHTISHNEITVSTGWIYSGVMTVLFRSTSKWLRVRAVITSSSTTLPVIRKRRSSSSPLPPPAAQESFFPNSRQRRNTSPRFRSFIPMNHSRIRSFIRWPLSPRFAKFKLKIFYSFAILFYLKIKRSSLLNQPGILPTPGPTTDYSLDYIFNMVVTPEPVDFVQNFFPQTTAFMLPLPTTAALFQFPETTESFFNIPATIPRLPKTSPQEITRSTTVRSVADVVPVETSVSTTRNRAENKNFTTQSVTGQTGLVRVSKEYDARNFALFNFAKCSTGVLAANRKPVACSFPKFWEKPFMVFNLFLDHPDELNWKIKPVHFARPSPFYTARFTLFRYQ